MNQKSNYGTYINAFAWLLEDSLRGDGGARIGQRCCLRTLALDYAVLEFFVKNAEEAEVFKKFPLLKQLVFVVDGIGTSELKDLPNMSMDVSLKELCGDASSNSLSQ